MKYIFLLFVISSFISCEGYDARLKIKNSTAFDAYILDHDTLSLVDYPNEILGMESYFFPKDTTGQLLTFGAGDDVWPDYVRTSRNKKLNLFVIPADTIKAYPKDTIIKYKKYYKVLSYSLKELEKMNWKVEIK